MPVVTVDTNTLSYWLNWRFFLCAVWVLTLMIVSVFVIWKYEGSDRRRGNRQRTAGIIYKDEAWGTCLRGVHPGFLLGYRISAFILLLTLLTVDIVTSGGGIFYFYTQWTFSLVTIYFALGSAFSIYGCWQSHHEVGRIRADHLMSDTEGATYIVPFLGEHSNMPNGSKNLHTSEEAHDQVAGVWGYIFQIIFQVCGGAAVLTDSVFWFALYPLLMRHDYELDFMIVGVHSINAVLLLGDTILNRLRFPLFRIAYFVLWTGMFVIFQWVLHACVSMWWPYPFMDLSPPSAPLCYLAVGLMHIPSYGIFSLLVKLKHIMMTRSFPESYQYLR